jgi:hypothetical protein
MTRLEEVTQDLVLTQSTGDGLVTREVEREVVGRTSEERQRDSSAPERREQLKCPRQRLKRRHDGGDAAKGKRWCPLRATGRMTHHTPLDAVGVESTPCMDSVGVDPTHCCTPPDAMGVWSTSCHTPPDAMGVGSTSCHTPPDAMGVESAPCCNAMGVEPTPCRAPLDTVGAICLDMKGESAAGVSSGGISLKSPGRTGQATMFGCGCWADNEVEANSRAVAASTSGETRALLYCNPAPFCMFLV